MYIILKTETNKIFMFKSVVFIKKKINIYKEKL